VIGHESLPDFILTLNDAVFELDFTDRSQEKGIVMIFRKIAGVCLGLIVSVSVLADEVVLKASHPDRYVVVKGDTLWDISDRFLRDAWRWPDIWEVNQQIENPHLIYPGDLLELTYVDGKPRLRLHRGSRDLKLSPRVRATPIGQAIPTIPTDAIKQFLTKPRVVGVNELQLAPYVVGIADEHVLGGVGDRVYVRSIGERSQKGYTIFRPGGAYEDGQTGEVLGFEAIYIADTALERTGDPATLLLTKTAQEVTAGDRLLPISEEIIEQGFMPHTAADPIEGRIISVFGGVSQIGQYQVIVIDRGIVDGVEVGHVFDILQRGAVVRDMVSTSAGGAGGTVKLPNEKAGLMMVFRAFDRVSFALVLKATRAIHLQDIVKSP